ncbi:MAG: N-acetyltransferase [Mailhella sp.]|nr:N-acetyltransferase [Mailhella sp.]
MSTSISAPQRAKPGSESTLPDLSNVPLPSHLSSRHARIQDVDGMSSLINEFAAARIMLARGPLYLYQNIQDYRVITIPVAGKETVVACGGLHVLWEDLAEVRSVAVHPALQRRGVGRLIVQDLISDAWQLGAAHVFTFTLAPGFFSSLGFAAVDRDTLSPVVWAECSKCPKFYKCDEVGMMLHFPPRSQEQDS